MPDSDLSDYLKSFENQISNIKDDIFRISWFMRGGVTSYELFHVYSRDDRVILNKIIKDNIDLSNKSGMPFV
jgi:hypothetical protein